MNQKVLLSFAGFEIDQLTEQELKQLTKEGFDPGDLSFENIFKTTYETSDFSISRYQYGLRVLKEKAEFIKLKPKEIRISEDIWLLVFGFVREAGVIKIGQNNQDQVGPSSPVTLHLVLHYKDLFKLTAIAHDAVHGKDNHNKMIFKYDEGGTLLLSANPLFLPRCSPYHRIKINGMTVFFFVHLMVCIDLARINYPDDFKLDDRKTWTGITSSYPGILAAAFIISTKSQDIRNGVGNTGEGVISYSLNDFKAVIDISTSRIEEIANNCLIGDNLENLIQLERNKDATSSLYMVLEPLVNANGIVATESLLYNSPPFYWSNTTYNGSTYTTFETSQVICGPHARDIIKLRHGTLSSGWLPPGCNSLKEKDPLIHTPGNCNPPVMLLQKWYNNIDLVTNTIMKDIMPKKELINFINMINIKYKNQDVSYIEVNDLSKQAAKIFNFKPPFMITQYGKAFKIYIDTNKEKKCEWYSDSGEEESESDWNSTDESSSNELEDKENIKKILNKSNKMDTSLLSTQQLTPPINSAHSLSLPNMPPCKFRKTTQGKSITKSTLKSQKEQRGNTLKAKQQPKDCKNSKKRKRKNSDEEEDNENYNSSKNANNILFKQ